ncbi:MAG: flavodoxin domain-containing protein [Acutalibacteraceae bacterium]
MQKTGVIYCSKTGFTRKYAEWLAEALGCEAVPYHQAAKTNWTDCDTVIFASWFHAGRIQKLGWFKRLPLTGKTRIVAAVGAMPADAPEAQAALRSNFADDWAQFRVFYLPGGLCYEKMGAADRALMAIFRRMARQKEGADSPTFRALSQSYDLTSREALTPVIACCRETHN